MNEVGDIWVAILAHLKAHCGAPSIQVTLYDCSVEY